MFFGLIYIVVKGLWLEPLQEQREAAWRAFGDAKTVQMMANMHYYPKDLRNLDRPFSAGMPALGLLHSRAKRAGISLKTEYRPNSIGHALSLSNRVLTGNTEPVMLDLFEISDELRKREEKLADKM